MKKFPSVLTMLALALALGVGTALMAQEPSQPTAPPSTQSDQPSQAQPPANQNTPTSDQTPQQDQTQPSQSGQTPDTTGQATDSKNAQAAQTFSGTINKQGDQYVLQGTDGTTYNIDDQATAGKYAGKKVNIHGTLGTDGKTIHVK